MKEKKQSKDWYVAATHYITAGFAIPLILSLVLGVPLSVVFIGNQMLLAVAFSIVGILSVWLGVIYSSKYVNKTYVIKNSEKIVNLATIYFAFLGGGYSLLNVSWTNISTMGLEVLIGLIFLAAKTFEVVIFYILSKKYIKNSENNIAM